jgi:hypothetical protein
LGQVIVCDRCSVVSLKKSRSSIALRASGPFPIGQIPRVQNAKPGRAFALGESNSYSYLP